MHLLDFTFFLKHLYPLKLDLDPVLDPVFTVGTRISNERSSKRHWQPVCQSLLWLFFALRREQGEHLPSLLFLRDPRKG